MPVAGRKPKAESERRNHVPARHDWIEVEDSPFDGKMPSLPREFGWPAATRRWWRTVSRMPHCRLWGEADWQFALDTAVIAAQFHGGDMRMAAELRLREKVLGTTLDARRDLRIRYVKPGEQTLAPVLDLAADPRARLGAVADEPAS